MGVKSERDPNTVDNPYLEYSYRPLILGPVKEMVGNEMLQWSGGNGETILKLKSTEILVSNRDLKVIIEETFSALLTNVAPGTDSSKLLHEEYENYQSAEYRNGVPLYGELVYYPLTNRIVVFAPKNLHQSALVARNEAMIQDPNLEITPEELRRVFGNRSVGFIGASVNGNLFHRILDTMRPGHVKVADPDINDYAVRNRRRFNIEHTGLNKAEAIAEEAHQTDPWQNISVFPEGVDFGNIDIFMLGDGSVGEPPVDTVFEACDDLEMKFEIAKYCREQGIDLWRISDIGVGRQVEYFPFSRYPDFPLSLDASENELNQALDYAQMNPNNDNFFRFAFLLIGDHYKNVPEFRQFIDGVRKTDYKTAIPQLAIASESAASDAALGYASVVLGHNWPNRYFIEPRKGIEIREWVIHEEGKIRRITTSSLEATVEEEFIQLPGN